ncbi:hypothetical protein BU15DRAFT_89424 [Melanogaster broomeanus]|nr:hypothetical protein BU15DRAFT_89424 [Melanogaster broomeanus]
MAVLAPSDWHPPRDHTMEGPSNSTIPRQRSSPANDHSSPLHPQQSIQQHSSQSQQPYPYPVQQPQGAWNPSVSAQPFYPSFYQNQHQHHPAQPYPLHPHQTQTPYYDPAANAQLAQWAYQQMMYNAQAQMGQHSPIAPTPQRSGSSSAPASPAEYFNPGQLFNHFPSGTPPPHQHHSNHAPAYTQRTASAESGRAQYEGFHPYRRPQNSTSGRPAGQESDWRSEGRTGGEASDSSTSVNSSNSNHGNGNGNGATRQRTSSMQGPVTSHMHVNGSASHQGSVRSRSGSAPQSTSAAPPPSSDHDPRSTYAATPTPPITPMARVHSSQADRRISRDDSDLAAMLESTAIGLGGTGVVKSGGLKSRLRRALSLNAAQALQEEEDEASAAGAASGSRSNGASASAGTGALSPTDTTDAASTLTAGTIGTVVGASPAPAEGGGAASTTGKKKSRAASLFNSRLNASTDNISLSSTMSSASVVIRKIGSIGKLARRNSLAGITSLFKDKKDKERRRRRRRMAVPVEKQRVRQGRNQRRKRTRKGSVVEPSVSHAVAELDRGGASSGDWSDASLSGLSPAAKLARQHTLKSNAEAAAKAKAAAEAQAQAAAQAQSQAHGRGAAGSNGSGVPVPAWEKNTTTRGDGAGQARRVGEDGTRIVVEDDSDSGSDDGHGPAHGGTQGQNYISDGWDDDEPWPEEEEDVTIRMPAGSAPPAEDEEVAEWAQSMRKSIDRTRTPTKGILKGADNYTQDAYVTDQTANPSFSRTRSNSYNVHPTSTTELGPLAHIPSPDPDHIDGLHRHPHSSSVNTSNAGGNIPSLPPLSFTSSSDSSLSSDLESGRSSPHHAPLFTLPNSSAPALSTIQTTPTTLSHRTASGPTTPKRLVFANNLSVYDTFSSTVYDRRSEPATWSRLTPALAQRIKEELNSYKMEEMEVHACSRMQ